MTEPENIHWQRRSFKGNKVWVACDAQGSPLLKKGRAQIKYNLDQPHEYWVSPGSLKPEDQAVPAGTVEKKRTAVLPAETGPGADCPADCIRIYTDGAASGNPGPAGIGILMIYKDNRKEISEYIGDTTNNIAELTAIQRALSSLKRQDLPVRIFTDSDYAVGLLTQGWTPRANKTLVTEILSAMGRFNDLTLVKVKGHSGIKENEVADFLAVSAIKKAKGTEK